MPLIKSKSKGAFAHNVKAEIAAGKPPKQAVAIAYETKRSAGGRDPESHSSHSAKRSKHYHEKVVATKVYRGPTMMTQARSQKLQNNEDWTE
jgi:hypothetical protein